MPGTPAPATPTAPPAGDMVIQTPEGPRTVDSAEVLVDKVLTGAGIEPEPKPTVPQSTLDRWDAEGKAADEKLRKAGLLSGKLRSANPIELAQFIRDMAISIRGDVARGVIHAKNFVQEIVDRFGEDKIPVARQVFEQAQKLVAQGMPSAAPQTAPGASAAAPPSLPATQPTGSSTGQPAQVAADAPLEQQLPPVGDPGDPEIPIKWRLYHSTKAWAQVKRRALQLYQMAQKYPRFKPIQEEIKAQHDWDAERNQWINLNGDTLKVISALGRKKRQKLFVFSAHIRLLELKHETALTEQQVMQIANNHGLDDKTVAAYQKMQDYFRASWEGTRQAEIQELQRTVEDPAELAKAIEKTNQEFAELAGTHYYPFKRFGNYIVTATIPSTDPKHKSGWKIDQTAHFESEHAALQTVEKMKAEYRAKGQEARVYPSEKLSQEIQNLASLPPGIAKRLADKLGLTAEQRAELSKLVADRITENSYANHLKHVKGTAGFSTDGFRALAAYGQSHGTHMADTLHGHRLEQAVADAKQEIKNMGYRGEPAVDILRMQDVLKVMDEAKNNMLNPKVRGWAPAGWANAMQFIFNPKQIAINLTQSMMTAPILSQQDTPGGTVGMYEAYKQTGKAMYDVGHTFSTRQYRKVRGKMTGAPDQYEYIGSIEPEVWEAMEKAGREGVLGDTQTAYVASQARSSVSERYLGDAFGLSGEATGRVMDKAIAWTAETGLKGHQMSEVYNRRVAFVATYRALKAAGHPDPYAGAVHVIKMSQGYNSPSNRSWLQMNAPNMMMFKSYTMNNAYLQLMSKHAFRLWMAQLVMSGLQGGLGFEHIFKFIDALGSWLKKRAGYKDPHVDIKRDIRDLSNGLVGRTMTELLMNGVSGGGGIPGVPDVSGSTGQGRVLPFVDTALDVAHGTVDYKTAVEREVRDLGGAPAGMIMDIAKSLIDDGPESFKFFKALTPRFLGQLGETYRAVSEGGVQDSAGNMLAPMDTSNPRDIAELIAMAMGFPSARVRKAQQANWAAKEHIRYFDSLFESLQDDYNAAQDSEDQDKIDEVNARINDMNDNKLPEGIHRWIGQFHQNYLAHKRGEQRAEEGNIGPRQWWPESQRIRDIYGAEPVPQE